MGIFTFLKKVFSEPEKIEPVNREKIAFSNIEEFIEDKINRTNSKETEIISIIGGQIDIFSNELKEKIDILKKVNFEEKDKNEKIKSATHEGRKKYIEFLERFIYSLENLNETSLEKVTEEINLAFTRFNENSSKSYERATILIGKEMGNIRETIKKFSSELIIIFNENKGIITDSKRFSLIKSQFQEIKEIRENSKKVDEEISILTNKVMGKEKENKEISKNIDKIKNSPEYIENIKEEKSIKIQEEQLEMEILNLKQLIDFKALSSFFHIFEDKMTLVKAYRDNFTAEFKYDRGNNLLNLLNESNLNNDKIDDKINIIEYKENNILHNKSTLKKDETLPLMHYLEKVNQEAQGFINEIGWAKKKKEKLQATEDELIKLIKNELGLMNVDLEY
jgi:hypothetical protein